MKCDQVWTGIQQNDRIWNKQETFLKNASALSKLHQRTRYGGEKEIKIAEFSFSPP